MSTTNKSHNTVGDSKGVFLETTALILNSMGPIEIRDGIVATCKDRPIATSEFCLDEYETVVAGLYDGLHKSLMERADPDRPIAIDELLNGVTDGLRPVIPGGTTQFANLCTAIAFRFAGKTVTAREVCNWMASRKRLALHAAVWIGGRSLRVHGEVHDNSSCCAFGKFEPCPDSPAEHCRLAWVCNSHHEEFIASVEIVSKSGREESSWLGRNFGEILSRTGVSLLSLIAKRIGHFGDVLVFWSVPEGWTLLTRDKTFHILQRNLSRGISIFRVRRARKDLEIQVAATKDGAHDRVSCKITNLSSKDACIVADSKLGKLSEVVSLSWDDTTRQSTVRLVRIDSRGGQFEHGVRFMLRH